MKKPLVTRAETLLVALLTSLLASCGGDKPDSLIASGKDFLAKNDNKAAIIQFKNALQQNPELGEARFLLGKALLDGGDFRGAEVELRKASNLKFSPDLTIPLLAKAMLAGGQANKVVNEFSKTELSGEAAANLKTLLSQTYEVMGNREAAKEALAAALSAKPDYAPALIASARAKAAQDDIAGAHSIIDGILGKTPGDPDALMMKGSLLAFKGDQTGAMEQYMKAVQSKPDFIPAHTAIISNLMQKGSFDDAAKQLEIMKKVAPKNLQTLYLEAQLAYQHKDFKGARDLSQQLLKAAPDSPLFLQLAGAVEYQLGSYIQAEAFLNKALQQAPELKLARSVLVTNYLRGGLPAKALSTLQPVLDKIDKDAAFLALAGEAYLQSGDPKKAEEYFDKANKLDPENPSWRTSLALSHMAQGDVATATTELERVSRDDKGITADSALIASYLRRNELEKALAAIDVLQKKKPDDPAPYIVSARILLAKKDNTGARQSLEKAVALNPAYIPAVAGLAAMDMSENKPDDARKRFESVIATDPKNSAALLALAKLTLATHGKPEDALVLINKAVSGNPAEAKPRLALIEFHLAQKDPKKAAAVAQDALAAIPDNPELLNAAGVALHQAGDVNQALATYTKLATLQPTSPLAPMRIAEIQIAEKNVDEAVKYLRKALEIKAELLDGQRKLIASLLAAGKGAEVLRIARDLQKQRPKEAIGYILEGDVQASEKHWPEAVASYRAGLKQTPSPELTIRLHKALLATQNTAEADKTASEWLKKHPKDDAMRLYLGDLAIARKDYPVALQYYRSVVDQQPENALALNNLAWVSGQLKSPKAIEYAEKANKLAPNQPALMDTLAMLMADKGDTAGALALLRKALDISPQAAPIRLNLARVLISAGRKDEARTELETLATLGDKFSEQAEVTRLQKTF
jgi:cellulose synthase operon protein C